MTLTNTARIASLETWRTTHKAEHAAGVIHKHDPAPPPPPPPSTYTFADEFDTLSPKWVPHYGPGDPGDRLDSDCMGNLSQVSVANSILTITVERKATPSGRPFAGACISTFGTFAQKYGTFEARIRYDAGKGSWHSFFLEPEGQKGPFPEVDIFEVYGDPACLDAQHAQHVVHYSPTSKDQAVCAVTTPAWHTWKIEWRATFVEFFVDGISTFRSTAHPPQVPMYPIFIAGVGAPSAPCRADATTPTMRLDVDWIRVSA